MPMPWRPWQATHRGAHLRAGSYDAPHLPTGSGVARPTTRERSGGACKSMQATHGNPLHTGRSLPRFRRLRPLASAKTISVIRVATDATFPPFEFFKNGKRTGFDIELIELLAKNMGKKVEWTDIDFKGLIPGLVSRRFDVASSAIYITEERRRVVDFTDPYYPGGLVVL